MYLYSLSLLNFKNCKEAELTFSPKINCFVGNNGEGKTNLLDAIYYLSFCKSCLNPIDSQNINHDEPFFLVKGVFDRDNVHETVSCGVKRNQKKQFKLNNKDYQRLADHIGLFPLVIVSPADSEIISGGSEIRRHFLNSVISQYDRFYLEHLISYNKLLEQRNSVLKQMSAAGMRQSETLQLFNERIEPLGNSIYEKRHEFITRFEPIFQYYYSYISGDKEKVSLTYQSHLSEGSFIEKLERSIAKDLALEYTTVGIHKDDMVFQQQGFPVKRFGSQGQQKSFLLALKLAEFDFISEIKGFKPIMLFDDVFDKLDRDRVTQLLKLVSDDKFGQIFITDTGYERTSMILQDIKTSYALFDVKGGEVTIVERQEN